MRSVRIVGSGLIGTSIGLGLAANGISVSMIDADAKREALAQDLMGAQALDAEAQVDVVVFALPSSFLSQVIKAEFHLNPNADFIDIGSIKTKPHSEIVSIDGLGERFCGTHPMAGREVGGPESARADLFEGRPWIYCPEPHNSITTIETVRGLIELLGATPIMMTASDHDAAVAVISHLPQVVSSMLASQLTNYPEDWLALAGQGLRDTTRIAGSDPILWKDIISLNREKIRPLIQKFSDDLQLLLNDFNDDESIEALIENGRAGRAKIPGKHGGRSRDYYYLPIVIEDKPGQLARLFQECADAGVNVEDLTIEHSPGQFTGLISLALSEADSQTLSQHLSSRGWKVHGK